MKTIITLSIDIEEEPEEVVDHMDVHDAIQALCERFTDQRRSVTMVSARDSTRYLASFNVGDGPMFKVCDTIAEAMDYGDRGPSSSQEVCKFEGELLSIEYDSYGNTIVNGDGECTIYNRTGDMVNVDEREES